MNKTTALESLQELQKKMYAFNYATGTMYFDSVTTAPKDTANGRGEALSVLSGERYKIMTDPAVEEFLRFLDGCRDELDESQRRQVQLLLKNFDEMRKIPADEYVAFSKLINDSEAVWHTAKEQNDFQLFLPYLEKVYDTTKRFAGYIHPEKDPYDVKLDDNEEGLTREKCDEFFAALRSEIVPLMHRISEKKQIDDSFMYGDFPIDKQKELTDYIMGVMGIDRTHCGVGETEHPFTIEFFRNDVRITTNYHRDNFASSMFSVIHEGGHALYELGMGEDLDFTVLAGGVSMGIHESQSRLYENIIGRSKAFCKLIFPKLQELFPQQLGGKTYHDFYLAVNKSQPSLIRVEADELTYPLHIMVRYELEKDIFDGRLAVKDLPEAWNARMKEYLGIDVPSDREGVLQDSHWSGGLIGYFPSYAIGSAYGAQMIAKIMETVDVEEAISRGDLAAVSDWLRERIYKIGSLRTPERIFEDACGGSFDPRYYVEYLKNKYTEIYGL